MGVMPRTSWYSNWLRHYEVMLLNTIIVFGRQEPPATTTSNLKTIIQRVDEPLPEFAELTIEWQPMAIWEWGKIDLGVGRGCFPDGMY